MTGDGTVDTDLGLFAILQTQGDEVVDCRVVGCEIVATRPRFDSEPRLTTRVALQFRPNGPLLPLPSSRLSQIADFTTDNRSR